MDRESSQSQEFNIEPPKVTPENLSEVVVNAKTKFFERLGEMRLVDLLFMFERMGGKAEDVNGLTREKIKIINSEGSGIYQNPKLSYITKDQARAAAKAEIERRLKTAAVN